MEEKRNKLEFIDLLLWRGSALPPSDEGGAPKGRRERNKLQSLGFFSPPVSFADSPLVRGGLWGAVHDGATNCNLNYQQKTFPDGNPSGKQSDFGNQFGYVLALLGAEGIVFGIAQGDDQTDGHIQTAQRAELAVIEPAQNAGAQALGGGLGS